MFVCYNGNGDAHDGEFHFDALPRFPEDITSLSFLIVVEIGYAPIELADDIAGDRHAYIPAL